MGEGAAAVLNAQGAGDGAACPLHDVAAGDGVDGEEVGLGVQVGVADQAVDQGAAVRRAGAQLGAAERVEVDAGACARGSGRRIAARAAQAAQGVLQVGGDGVGLVVAVILAAVDRIDRPGPAEVEGAVQAAGQAIGVVFVFRLGRAVGRAEQASAEAHVLAEGVVGVAGGHDRRNSQDGEGGRRTADREGVAVAGFQVQTDAGSDGSVPGAEDLFTVFLRHQVEELREVETAEAVGRRVLVAEGEGGVRAVGVGREGVGAGAEIGAGLAVAGHRMPGGASEGRGAREAALVRSQGAAAEVAGRHHEVAARHLMADDALDIDFVRAVHRQVFGGHFRLVHRGPGDEVDHAGHRVGAIGGGAAVLDDLDPAHGDQGRQGIDVDEGAAVAGGGGAQRLATAVEQHQGGAQAQVAQVELGGARGQGLVKAVHLGFRARVGRQELDELAGVGNAALVDLVEVDHVGGGGLAGLADQRPGDDDVANLGGGLLLRGVNRGRRGLSGRGASNGRDRTGAQQGDTHITHCVVTPLFRSSFAECYRWIDLSKPKRGAQVKS